MTEEMIHRLRYDCELALQLGDEARVVLPAAYVRTIADRIEALEAENERLREEERAAIVAWLRGSGDPVIANWISAQIERGEHK